MKRFLDILLSCIALAMFLPFGLVICLILRFTGEGEIFYIQRRVGKNGKLFGLIKFATMLKNSPKMGSGDITVRNDPRVLQTGKILRKTKLNEVPQLINVLKGDMSIVGPRPQTPNYFALFSDYVQREIIDLKPGLTGVGSVVFRDEEAMGCNSGMDQVEFHKKVIAPYKGEIELWYKQKQSFWMDLKLVFLTAWLILFPSSKLYAIFLPGLPAQMEAS